MAEEQLRGCAGILVLVFTYESQHFAHSLNNSSIDFHNQTKRKERVFLQTQKMDLFAEFLQPFPPSPISLSTPHILRLLHRDIVKLNASEHHRLDWHLPSLSISTKLFQPYSSDSKCVLGIPISDI